MRLLTGRETHAMQPRQRSKCSTTVLSSAIVPSRRLHQLDAAARRVHLLAPEHVGGAGRQAEAAVDAVVGAPRSAAPLRMPFGSNARVPAGGATARPRPLRPAPGHMRRPQQGGRPPPPGAPVLRPVRRGRRRACLRPRPGALAPASRQRRPGPPDERARSLRLLLDGGWAALHEERHDPGMQDVQALGCSCEWTSAATTSGTSSVSTTIVVVAAGRVQAQRGRRACPPSRTRASRGRSRRHSSRPCHPRSRPCRPGTRVTPRTRSRGAPKRCRSGPERFAARQAPIVGSPGGSSAAAAGPASAAWSTDSRIPASTTHVVARLVLEDRSSPSVVKSAPIRTGRPRCSRPRGLGGLAEARDARQRRPSPAGARGTARALRRRGGGRQHLARIGDAVGVEGAPQPGEHLEVALREHLRHRARLVDADAVLARERPARIEAGEGTLGELARPLALSAAASRQPADAGCRRPRGRRCRRGGRAPARAPRSAAAPRAAASAERRRPGRSSRSRSSPSRRTRTCGPSRAALARTRRARRGARRHLRCGRSARRRPRPLQPARRLRRAPRAVPRPRPRVAGRDGSLRGLDRGRSIISIAEGRIPAATMPDTAVPAASVD